MAKAYWAALATAASAAVLTYLINGAVGMIGSEDNPYNMWFGAVLAVAFAGAVIARFRSAGMAWAMAAAALVQLIVGAGGLAADLRGGVFSMAFAALWLIAAALFRKAGKYVTDSDTPVRG